MAEDCVVVLLSPGEAIFTSTEVAKGAHVLAAVNIPQTIDDQGIEKITVESAIPLPKPLAAPTRAAILAGFADLAAKAGPGDFALIHFSGHGSTQPEGAVDESAEPEPGGRVQVLLPKDAGKYDAEARTIRNAIVDKEIGPALDELRLLQGFDRARPAILEVVDMPDRKADLFTRLVVQGNGIMNAGKRKRLFGELTDEEVERMTEIVRETFGMTPCTKPPGRWNRPGD